MSLKYTYSNGEISHYALKKIWGSCHQDENHTVLIGVFCRNCPFYAGEADDFIICEYHKKDDEGASRTRSKIYDDLRYEALCAFE